MRLTTGDVWLCGQMSGCLGWLCGCLCGQLFRQVYGYLVRWLAGSAGLWADCLSGRLTGSVAGWQWGVVGFAADQLGGWLAVRLRDWRAVWLYGYGGVTTWLCGSLALQLSYLAGWYTVGQLYGWPGFMAGEQLTKLLTRKLMWLIYYQMAGCCYIAGHWAARLAGYLQDFAAEDLMFAYSYIGSQDGD